MILKQLGKSLIIHVAENGLQVISNVDIDWLKPETWPTDSVLTGEGKRASYEIEMLLEMGLAERNERCVTIPYQNFAEIREQDIHLTTAYTQDSPLLLKIDRKSDIGRPNFEYVYRYLLGGVEVPIKRTGYYVSRSSTGNIWHLDDTMFALVDSMDQFNSLSEQEKNPQSSWLAFANIKGLAKQTGAILESTLQNNDVIVPSSLGLHLYEDAEGRLSFIPNCPELDSSDFQTVFQRNDKAQGFYSLDKPGLGKLRIVMSEKQLNVLERMKRVRAVTGAEKQRLIEDPRPIFDGVAGDVDLPYSDRVTGVGAFIFDSVPKNEDEGERMSSLWSNKAKEDDEKIEIKPLSLEAEKTTKLALLIDTHEDTIRDKYILDSEKARISNEMHQFVRPTALRHSISLKRHQESGIQWLQHCARIEDRQGVLLADDMGLGKTLQVLSFLAWAIESGQFPDLSCSKPPYRPILIVAPLILLDTEVWENEINKFFEDNGDIFGPVLSLYGHTLKGYRRKEAEGREDIIGKPILDIDRIQKYKIVITNYEAVRDYEFSFAYCPIGANGKKSLWSIVVSDEAHEYKTPNTKISHAMKAIQPDFRVACTGTPVENRLLDLWNIFDAIQPGLLGTAREFVSLYESPTASTSTTPMTTLKERLLYRKPEAFVLRRNKSEVLDLPKKHEHKIACQMSPFEVNLHLELRNQMGTITKTQGKLSLLQQFARLYQHPSLLNLSTEFSSEELLKQSSKLKELLTLLKDIQGRQEKVIIFCRHKDMQRMLAEVIKSKFGLNVRVINGDTSRNASIRKPGLETRNSILEEFKNRDGFDVLILSPFVAGVGLTIVEANHVIHYGRWWNPAVEAQATDRAYRIGQTKETHVYFLINEDSTGTIVRTFDQLLDDLMERKKDLAHQAFHHDDLFIPKEDEQKSGMEVYSHLA